MERGGWDELETRIDMHTPPCVKKIADGNLYKIQEAQSGVL